MMSYCQCSLRELIKNHQNLITKILKRSFSMYLNPLLKDFSLRSSKKISENSDRFDILLFSSLAQ